MERASARTNGCAGEACAVERAAYPLHCAGIDAELFGNDAHTGPRQGLTDSFFECRGNWRALPDRVTWLPLWNWPIGSTAGQRRRFWATMRPTLLAWYSRASHGLAITIRCRAAGICPH